MKTLNVLTAGRAGCSLLILSLAFTTATAEDETKTDTLPQASVTTPFPPIPEAVTSFGAAIAGDTLYIYGGHKGDAHRYYQEAQARTLWKLDLAQAKRGGAKWESLGKGPRLQGLAMVTHGDKLYRLGGFTAKNKDGEKQDLWSQAGVGCYSIKAKQWTALPTLPEPRSSFDAAVLGDSIYVIGGWQMKGDKDSVWHKSAWVMDLTQTPLKWSAIAEPPFQRCALAVAAHKGKVFAIGGMLPTGKTATQVHVYDPQVKKWSEGPNLPGKPMEGFGASAFAVGGKLYVTTYSGKLLKLSDDQSKWEEQAKLERARFFHRMLPLSRSALISVGGASMETGKFEKLDVIQVP